MFLKIICKGEMQKVPTILQCYQNVAIQEARLKRLMSCINTNWENHTLSSAFDLAEFHYIGGKQFS